MIFCRELPELNVFTKAQLLVLRKELGTFYNSRGPDSLQQVPLGS